MVCTFYKEKYHRRKSGLLFAFSTTGIPV